MIAMKLLGSVKMMQRIIRAGNILSCWDTVLISLSSVKPCRSI